MASGFDDRMSSLLSAIDKAVGGTESRKKSPLEEARESSLERKPTDHSDEPNHSRSPRHKGAETSPHDRRPERRGYRDREDHDRERAEYRGHGSHRRHEDKRDSRPDSYRRRNDYRTRHQPPPDYVKNPSKWKKYDLSHDGTEGLKRSGMTDDQVNSFAAFQFLRELRERKEREAATGEEEEGEVDSRGERKVVFRKMARRKQSGTTRTAGEGEDLTTRDSASGQLVGGAGAGVGVVKMAEYVVGGEEGGARSRRQKRKQLQALGGDEKEVGEKTRTSQGSKSSVSLSHLAELDEED